MGFVLATLLFLHGVVHLLGFVKAWKLAEVPMISGPTRRGEGLLWLLAALLLITAAGMQLLANEAWWFPGALGVLLSQGLIFSQWKDAKTGTVPNLILVLPLLLGAASAQFHSASDASARALLARASPQPPTVVRQEELAALPAPVQRWLETSGVVGRPRASTVRLLQNGWLRTSPDGPLLSASAEQYFTVDEPGFVWVVDVTMWGVPVVGRDSCVDGKGRMLIKAGGLVTLADGTGETFDQGTLLRYLGEIVWFPSAALAPYIAWEGLDAQHARATLTWRETTVSAVFAFDERGRVSRVEARRHYEGKTLEDWVIPLTRWELVRGVEIPTRGTAVWKLGGGDFEYYRWEIVDVETNSSQLWSEPAPAPEASPRAALDLPIPGAP